MILETSWEVCNKMGGIYTVLSSRADVMTQHHPAQVCFIGPLLADEGAALPLDFIPGEIPELQGWLREVLPSLGLRVVAGRWGIEGEPPVLLVDFKPLWREKDDLYFELWKAYGLESDKGYGDYDESSLFSIAAARLMASIAAWRSDERTIAIFNEWQTAMGLLYLRQQAPSVRTLFITHATTVGRSIAGNDKELYTYMDSYDGDQMARELGVEAKHEVEKLAAHKADVFATVSKLTAREAKQLLGREPVVLPNGFHVGTSPLAAPMLSKRRKSRRLLAAVASRLYGQHIDPARSFFISLGGRYEYRNKGIDLFIESLHHFAESYTGDRDIVAFLLVPAWQAGPRADLQYLLSHPQDEQESPLQYPMLSHWLYNTEHDRAVCHIRHRGLDRTDRRVKVVFVPCYLNGLDGIFDQSYYDLLVGMDLTIYPSYYEPWGYTPLESVRYGVPTITTTLAGFGLWAEEEQTKKPFASAPHKPVHIVERTDTNIPETIEAISRLIGEQLALTPDEQKAQRKKAYELARCADWKLFYQHYEDAYALMPYQLLHLRSRARAHGITLG
jgi:glycogen synthase, putative